MENGTDCITFHVAICGRKSEGLVTSRNTKRSYLCLVIKLVYDYKSFNLFEIPSSKTQSPIMMLESSSLTSPHPSILP